MPRKKAQPTSESLEEIDVSVDTDVVDPGDLEVASDKSFTLQVKGSSDDLYFRRSEDRGTGPEPAAMLTDDRLINSKTKYREVPEGFWQKLLYDISFHLINVGHSRAARERKAMDRRIAIPFEQSTRFVPVLTRKGGVGKTTVTTLLAMAMAEVREDRVLAIDANPDRGTLAERVNRSTGATVRDVVNLAAGIKSFTDFAELVSKDRTRLHVLASDTDPLLAEAFDEDDYNVVADQAAKYYSVVLTDCGTGVVHSVMRPTLQRANGLVVVSGGSVDEARLASETITWLESNGHEEIAKQTVVALNTATQGTNVVKLDEIERHFLSRVRDVVRIPYDPNLAAGSIIDWAGISPYTKDAARELAALVIEGMAEKASSGK